MSAISEEDARAALSAAHSEAYDPARFSASRVDGGWLFSWKPQNGDAPMGSRPWIVTDAGVARMLGFRQSAAEGIAEAGGG